MLIHSDREKETILRPVWVQRRGAETQTPFAKTTAVSIRQRAAVRLKAEFEPTPTWMAQTLVGLGK